MGAQVLTIMARCIRQWLNDAERVGPSPSSPLLQEAVEELHAIVYQVQRRMSLLTRSDQAMVRLWGQKLLQPTTNLQVRARMHMSRRCNRPRLRDGGLAVLPACQTGPPV